MTVRAPVTIDEFMRLRGDGRFDLIDGVVFYCKPAGALCDAVTTRVVAACRAAAEARGLAGRSGAAVVLGHSPNTALAPNVLYAAADKLPPERPRLPLTVVPEFVIEVRAPSERAPLVRRRIALYLAAGVQLVWLLDPHRRSASVFRQGEAERRLTEADELTGEGVLPGLSVRVGDLLD